MVTFRTFSKAMFFLSFLLFSFQLEAASGFPVNATFSIDSSWRTGYQVTVTLQNVNCNDATNWTSTFNLPQGHTVGSLWNGVYGAHGQLITVKNPTWIGGGNIPSGETATFGMIVNNPRGTTPNLLNLQAVANGTPVPIPVSPSLKPISVNPSAPNTYTVSWTSVPNAVSYTLIQDTTAKFSSPKIVAQGAIQSKAFDNQPNGTYYYCVFASNASGSGPNSNVQSIVINIPIQLNAPVLQPVSNPSGSGQYLVTWTAVANAQGYQLEEALNSDFSNSQIIYQGGNAHFQVSGRLPGTYYYRTTAYSGTIKSTSSNAQSVHVTQQPPASSAILEGYWESWNSHDPIDAIVHMKVDVIDVAFANFITTAEHTFVVSGLDCDQATLMQFINAAHEAGKKVKISIGGATYGLSGQLQSLEDAKGMAKAIKTFVHDMEFDGVDFDIEDYPEPSLQVALIQNTRELLGNNAIITYTPKTPASTTYPYDEVIQLGNQYLNNVSIMAYDYGPGYSYQQDIATLVSMGVPASKLIIGLMPGYDDLHVMTSLNDISNAAQFVMQNGLGGMMFWDLNRDYENLTGLGAEAATTTAWEIIH